jgi:hypothetical protein
MYRKLFPKCEIEGSLEPVKYEHFASQGAVPKKCISCSNLFEGECLRAVDLIEDYLTLDYGVCKIEGETYPVVIETKNENPICVPKKCLDCQFLLKSRTRGYTCTSEKEKWGDFSRHLDWGDWKPDYPLVGLRRDEVIGSKNSYLGGMIITKDLVSLLLDGKTTKAIKLYRTLNNIETIKEASEAMKTLSNKLNENYNSHS